MHKTAVYRLITVRITSKTANIRRRKYYAALYTAFDSNVAINKPKNCGLVVY